MLRQHPLYSVFTALSSCRIILRSLKIDLSSFQTRASDFGLAFLGGGGDDDDTVTQTPRTKSRRAALLGIYSTVVMSDHLIYSPNLLLAFAISKAKTRNCVWGRFCGDDHDTFSRTPRTISPHPSAHTPRTTSKANPPTPRSGL